MPPTDRPLPRFIAEQPRELEPQGRWKRLLEGLFKAACRDITSDEQLGQAGPIRWFPERTYAGRTYVPAAAETDAGYEVFGYVSFTRDDQSEPTDFGAQADYTSEIAARNPEWKLDLNDEVIGRWRGSGEATGELTLVWGTALVPGGTVATAELAEETMDQCPVPDSGRFTLVAVDAVGGFGEDLYLDVRLWNQRGEPLASESLYEDQA